MNIEVEIKLKIENWQEIRKKVSSLGKLVRSIKQIDEYYIPIHRDFFAQKPKTIEWMRVRKEPERTVFGYYRAIDHEGDKDGWIDEEYETEISNPEDFKKILGFLDFKKVITINKEREYWDCGDIEISLDKIKELGNFIEVEAKKNFKNNDEARQACRDFFGKLGIKDIKKLQTTKGYANMMLDKKLSA